jgi:hypothetical protein
MSVARAITTLILRRPPASPARPQPDARSVAVLHARMRPWRTVEDEEPPLGVPVALVDTERRTATVGYRLPDGRYVDMASVWRPHIHTPTHWAPLPEMPADLTTR